MLDWDIEAEFWGRRALAWLALALALGGTGTMNPS